MGKSTLFNRLTRSREALVANFPGLTRDRKYGEGEVDGRRFVVVDTGGISGFDEGIDSVMAGQSLQAIAEADSVMLLVDSRDGLTPADRDIVNHLRQAGKPFFLVANKIDGLNPDVALADFYQLGCEAIFPITATHGRGVASLMDQVLAPWPAVPSQEAGEEAERGIKIAVVGRPNEVHACEPHAGGGPGGGVRSARHHQGQHLYRLRARRPALHPDRYRRYPATQEHQAQRREPSSRPCRPSTTPMWPY